MWLVFILSGVIIAIVVALVLLLIVYIWHKVLRKMEHDDNVSSIEKEAYEQTKRKMKD